MKILLWFLVEEGNVKKVEETHIEIDEIKKPKDVEKYPALEEKKTTLDGLQDQINREENNPHNVFSSLVDKIEIIIPSSHDGISNSMSHILLA